MRKLVAATLSTMALSVGSAVAADLPVRVPVSQPPLIVPVYNWSGCYLGGQIGYAWAEDSNRETVTATGATSLFTPATNAKPRGGKLGSYLGCNWQVPASAVVVGLEGDIDWASMSDTVNFTNTGAPPDHYETKIRWQGSVRGRLGYAFNRLLVYAAGGFAFANINEHDVTGATGIATDNSSTRSGWTVGAGLDWAFAGNWVARIEYRYADFGTFSYNPAVFAGFTENHDITENAVRIGLSYKFW